MCKVKVESQNLCGQKHTVDVLPPSVRPDAPFVHTDSPPTHPPLPVDARGPAPSPPSSPLPPLINTQMVISHCTFVPMSVTNLLANYRPSAYFYICMTDNQITNVPHQVHSHSASTPPIQWMLFVHECGQRRQGMYDMCWAQCQCCLIRSRIKLACAKKFISLRNKQWRIN